MVSPGEVYWADLPEAARRPVIVVSRNQLNRGDQVVVVPLTTAKWDLRRNLPNCVSFFADEFGISRNCVAQVERIASVNLSNLDFENGPIGELDALRLRDLIRTIGYVLDAECEPT